MVIPTDIDSGPRSESGDIGESLIENPIKRFSQEELDGIGRLFDQLHDEVRVGRRLPRRRPRRHPPGSSR